MRKQSACRFRITNFVRGAAAMLLIVSMIACPGCGSPEVCSLSGTITYDGKPIEDGSIRLDPIAADAGPTGKTIIKNGKYEISSDQGMQPGKFEVAIYAVFPTGREIPAPEHVGDETKMIPEMVLLPEKYNAMTELSVALQVGENTQNFDLEK